MRTAPAGPRERFDVLLSEDREHSILTTVDHWSPRGSLLPQPGDRCLVTPDDEGHLWLAEWEPQAAEGPEPQRATFEVGDLKFSALTPSDGTWLPCDGRGITSAMGFPVLRAGLIARTYPYGTDGSGNPRIPDLRDRALVGGGSTHTAGHAFGSETVTLDITQIPAHTHTPTGATVVAHDGFAGSAASLSTGGAALRLGALTSRGGGLPHQNTQPSLAIPAYILAAIQ